MLFKPRPSSQKPAYKYTPAAVQGKQAANTVGQAAHEAGPALAAPPDAGIGGQSPPDLAPAAGGGDDGGRGSVPPASASSAAAAAAAAAAAGSRPQPVSTPAAWWAFCLIHQEGSKSCNKQWRVITPDMMQASGGSSSHVSDCIDSPGGALTSSPQRTCSTAKHHIMHSIISLTLSITVACNVTHHRHQHHTLPASGLHE